jgi:hypothetical protein
MDGWEFLFKRLGHHEYQNVGKKTISTLPGSCRGGSRTAPADVFGEASFSAQGRGKSVVSLRKQLSAFWQEGTNDFASPGEGRFMNRPSGP